MTSGGRLCFLLQRHSTSNSPTVVCIPRRDPTGSLCCDLGVLGVQKSRRHSSATTPGGLAACQIDNSERGAELGAEGLHKGLLGRCANTRHCPSCAVQNERINSSEPSKEETPALLTSGCQRLQEAVGSQAGAGFTISALCIPCLIFPAFQQGRCMETSQLTLGFLNGETNLAFLTQGKNS